MITISCCLFGIEVNIGNEHTFFFLEGAKNEEKNVRPFFNEFLNSDLSKHKRVLEALGNKLTVKDVDQQQLSGLGFSSTQRESFFVRVTGSFKRVLKVEV